MNPSNSPIPSAAAGAYGSGDATESSGTLSEMKTDLTRTARDAAAKVKRAASSTASRAREEVGRYASDKKAVAAGRIDNCGSAMHETARSLEEKDPNIAWFTHQAADKLQDVAEYMRDRDLGALRHDAEEVARRHPAIFFGGMFLAGLVLGNVVKASRRGRADRNFRYDDDETREREEYENQNLVSEAEHAATGM